MIWFDTSQVGRLQIESTNYCNAACPQCDRSEVDAKTLNNTMHTIDNYQRWFGDYEWPNLDYVHFCGSVDEPTINPSIIEICEWFYNLSENISWIDISTNGGTRDESFWTQLGNLSKKTGKVRVIWGIDGLEDTNHIYRRNVRWDTLQRNFRAYHKAGGISIWQFIIFGHNKHQLDDIKELVDKEGFSRLTLIHSDREVVDTIENYRYEKIEIPEWYDTSYANKDEGVKINQLNENKSKDISIKPTPRKCVKCIAKPNSKNDTFHPEYANIYVSVHGYVTPCCWLGNPNELTKLWKEHSSDQKLHNLHHTKLHNIIDGYWKHIDDKLQSYPTCVNKCQLLQTSLSL